MIDGRTMSGCSEAYSIALPCQLNHEQSVAMEPEVTTHRQEKAMLELLKRSPVLIRQRPLACRDDVAAADGHATNGAVRAVSPTMRPSASARTKLIGTEEATASGSRGQDAAASSSGHGSAGESRGAVGDTAAQADRRRELFAWTPDVPVPALQRLLQQVGSSKLYLKQPSRNTVLPAAARSQHEVAQLKRSTTL